MYSLREYCRPERANRISPEEAVWTYRKALRVVVDNERKVLLKYMNCHSNSQFTSDVRLVGPDLPPLWQFNIPLHAGCSARIFLLVLIHPYLVVNSAFDRLLLTASIVLAGGCARCPGWGNCMLLHVQS